MAISNDNDRKTQPGVRPDEDVTTDKHGSRPQAHDASTDPDPGRAKPGGAIHLGHVVGDRYRLVDRLGKGGMGEVFVAENLAIHLRVAVKLLKPELYADRVFRERFEQEAQAVASIDHPNVARFLDLVIGEPTFLVMEYVRGPTLAERIKRGPLAPHEAVAIAVRLCWALDAAHQAGIIHRDLKPANVILTPDRERGETPKLIDFGLAKLARTTDSYGLTRTGQVVGTPKYMAPEQIAGRSVDARSDIYSLGCVLYEMLTGKPPFDGSDDVQVLYQQINDNPAPIHERAPHLSAQLAAVVTRLLQKIPADRFQTMEELARGLERTLPRRGAGSAGFYDSAPAPTTIRRVQVQKTALASAVLFLSVTLGFVGGFALHRGGRLDGAQTTGVMIVTDPSGADVELDGRPLPGKTPTWAADVTPGAHTVKVRRAGTSLISETVAVHEGERAVVQVTLPPSSHALEVRTRPDGAQLYLDGHLTMGETPTTIEITDDDFHELRVVKNGYQTLTKAITPDDKMPSLSLPLVLETAPRGAIVAESVGSGEVWIDGLDSGYAAPSLAMQVATGRHSIELRDSTGARGPTVEVVVERGQTLRVQLTPPAPPRAAK